MCFATNIRKSFKNCIFYLVYFCGLWWKKWYTTHCTVSSHILVKLANYCISSSQKWTFFAFKSRINLFYLEYVHMSRTVCQFIGFLYILLLYSGTSLHGGIVQETKRTKEGVLLPNFFLTYLLATKLVKNKTLQIWQLLSFLDTLSPFWSQP